MKDKKLLYSIYFILIFLVSTACAVLRTIAVFENLNYETGFFFETPYISISDKLVIGASFFALSYIFTSKKQESLMFKFDSPLNYVFSGIVSAALIFSAANAFRGFLSAKEYVDKYKDILLRDISEAKLMMYLLGAIAIFALLSVFHFLYAAIETKRRSTKRADFGLIMVIFLALYTSYLYFNQSAPINAPIKLVDQMTYLFAALFFLFETRISIGRERWRAYASFGFIAMMLSAYSSIPSLAIYIFKGRIISDSIYESCLTFTLFLFILARLLMLASLPEDKESKAVSALLALARERAAKLEPEIQEPSSAESVSSEETTEEYYELNFESTSDEITEKKDEENTGY